MKCTMGHRTIPTADVDNETPKDAELSQRLKRGLRRCGTSGRTTQRSLSESGFDERGEKSSRVGAPLRGGVGVRGDMSGRKLRDA